MLNAATFAGRDGMDAAGNRVKVAVFDTWPVFADTADLNYKLRKIRDFANSPTMAGSPAQARLTLWGNGTLVPAANIQDFVTGTTLASLECRRRPTGPGAGADRDFTYDMSDHGLFVADIIKELAPNADVLIYRVLNDRGIGDLAILVEAVNHALTNFGGGKLILNFSLGFAPEVWRVTEYLGGPEVAFDDGALWSTNGDVRPETDVVVGKRSQARKDADADFVRDDRALRVVKHLLNFDLDGPDQMFAVAAAGNDSRRLGALSTHRVSGPRMPAAIEGILGVSAIQLQAGSVGQFTTYSNDDDLRAPDDGVGAFGGEANPPQERFIGLFVSPNIPSRIDPGDLEGPVNHNGLAGWSGTSFAAPIASGIAACVWSEEPTRTPQSLLNGIVTEPDGLGGRQERAFINLRR